MPSACTVNGVPALDPSKRHLVAERIASKGQSSYRRNHLAASLRGGRSNLVGVLLPDITNTVFAPILGGIAEILSKDGYVADAGNDAAPADCFCRSFA
jgi:LacI family transcriptional regulator